MSALRNRLRKTTAQRGPYGYLSGLRVAPTTDTGWATYNAGSRLLLPAGTNHLTNPAFVTDTDADGLADGISASIVNATVTPSLVTRTVNGKSVLCQSIRVVAGAGVGVTVGADFDTTAVGSFAQNDYATASAYLKVTELQGCTLRLQVVGRNEAGSAVSTISSTAITAVDSDFVRRSVTAQLTHADTSRASVKIVTVANFEEGDSFTIEIAMAELEKFAFLLPYFDGSYSGCAWTGTAHASTSTRTVSALNFPPGSSPFLIDFLNPAEGTIAYRTVPVAIPAAIYGCSFGLYGPANQNSFNPWGWSTNQWWISVDGPEASTADIKVNATPVVGTPVYTVLRWTQGPAGTLDLNVNGVDAVQVAQTQTIPEFHATLALRLMGSTAEPHYIGPMLISATRQSDAWVASIQGSGGAAYDNLNALWNLMGSGDLLLPLKSDAVGRRKVGGMPPFEFPYQTQPWVRQGFLEGALAECSVVNNGAVWQAWGTYGATAAYSTASDLLGPWTRGDNQALPGPGAVNASYMRSQVRVIDGTYHMLVACNPDTVHGAVDWSQQFDHFTSADGLTWTLSQAAVLEVGDSPAWDWYWLGNVEFWLEDGIYYMLYEAGSYASPVMKLGLATASSLDGPWTKYAGNPVIGTEQIEAGSPTVIKKDGVYCCWFHGGYSTQLPTDIWRAVGTSPYKWVIDPSPVMVRATEDEGAGSSVGQMADPEVLEYDGTLYMFYTAAVNGQGVGPWIAKLATATIV